MTVEKKITSLVLAHYHKHKRDLPWRKRSDAYAIWISEIMLQQTRVTAVIPYFNAWLERFPTIETLAKAPLDDVLARWSGLGYYRRARNIHACAQEVQARYAGRLPKEASALRSLPGIGRYTAGAISSIAYQEHEALVDGNVARLVSRLFVIEDEIKSTVAAKKHWAQCQAMVPKHAPGEFNQGLMEIGALICLPKKPKCEICPLTSSCMAFAQKRTETLPVTTKPVKTADKALLALHAVWVFRRKKILLGHRSAQGLYGALWELPQANNVQELPGLTGLQLSFHTATPRFQHAQVLSHRRLQIDVWTADATGRTKLSNTQTSYQRLAWFALEELSSLGLSSATQSILKKLKQQKALL